MPMPSQTSARPKFFGASCAAREHVRLLQLREELARW
jgi:hypothetical protein